MTCSTCTPWLFAAQPKTVFGTPDTLIVRGVGRTLDATASFVEDIVRAVSGKSSAKAIASTLKGLKRSAPVRKVSSPIRRELLQGSMLGALDAEWEGEEDEAIAPEAFARPPAPHLLVKADPSFAGKTLEDAIRAFLKREPVTRETFDSMEKAAQRRAFTVAKAATEAMVETVQLELARQVAKGADLADFGKAAAKRLEAAGWTPANPSHLATVFRTNVLGSYGGGRAQQMTQPAVIELRPFWEVLGIRDGRQRKNHEQLFGVVLRATDPFWLEAFPPFGYNCRCRCRSLSLIAGAPRVQEGKGFLRYVPDEGFASGLDQAALAAGPLSVPDEPPPSRRPSEPPPSVRPDRAASARRVAYTRAHGGSR